MHSGMKTYGCDLCGKRFLDSLRLRMHLLSHSGNMRVTSPFPHHSAMRVVRGFGYERQAAVCCVLWCLPSLTPPRPTAPLPCLWLVLAANVCCCGTGQVPAWALSQSCGYSVYSEPTAKLMSETRARRECVSCSVNKGVLIFKYIFCSIIFQLKNIIIYFSDTETHFPVNESLLNSNTG